MVNYVLRSVGIYTTFIMWLIELEYTAGADASVKVQKHEATR